MSDSQNREITENKNRNQPASRLGLFRVKHAREIMALATPTILTMLSHTLMWTVDTALLGRYSSIALAAAGLGGIMAWTVYSMFNNLSRITGTFVAQAYGKQDNEAIGHYLWQGIYLAICAGLLIQAGGYFSQWILPWTHNPPEVLAPTYTYIKWRTLSAVFTQVIFVLMAFFQGRRDVRIPMYAGIIGNVVNLVLDVWLIFGWSGFELFGNTWLAMPAMGIKGAAIGTSIGTFINFVALAYWAFAPKHLRSKYQVHKPRRPDFRAISNMVRIGVPAAWENFTDMSGFLLFTIFVGTTGAIPLACSQITIQLMSFGFMPLWGLTTAAGVFTGNHIGAGKPDLAADYGRQVYKLGTYYSIILATILVLARNHVFKIFSTDPEVLAFGASLAVVSAIFQYFDGIRMLSAGILGGAGDTKYTMVLSTIIMWGLFAPVTWFLIVYQDGNVITAWVGASFCYLLMGGLMWRRFESGKWRKINIFR